MSKKRAFVRYSKQGKIVPGSLILTNGSYPQGPSTWKEVNYDICCITTSTTTIYQCPTVDVVMQFETLSGNVLPGNAVRVRCGQEAIAVFDYYIFPFPPGNIQQIANTLNEKFPFATFTVRNSSSLNVSFCQDLANELCPSGTLSIVPVYF